MSKRFGRNQKRRFRQDITNRDMLVRQFREIGDDYKKLAERNARDLMAARRELSHVLERSLQPESSITRDLHRHRTLRADVIIKDERHMVINSRDITTEAIYMLAGPEARRQFAIMLAKDFVKALTHGQGRKYDRVR